MNAAAALALTRSGLPCFPCGSDKRPLMAGGFKAATTDARTLERWWGWWPAAVPGVPTGRPSGIWICDIDTDRATGETVGEDAYRRLGLPWPPYSIRTPSGGRHLPFRYRPDLPRCSAGRLPGVDVRGDGGYVVAWQADTLIAAAADKGLPPPPEALLRALARPLPVRPAGPLPAININCASRWAAAALSGELAKVASAPVGERNHQLNRSAFKLAQLAAAGDLDLEAVASALLAVALAAGLGEREAELTIASGLAGGAKFPRVRRA